MDRSLFWKFATPVVASGGAVWLAALLSPVSIPRVWWVMSAVCLGFCTLFFISLFNIIEYMLVITILTLLAAPVVDAMWRGAKGHDAAMAAILGWFWLANLAGCTLRGDA